MAMATLNQLVALCILPFLDGPTLLRWKQISRTFDCYETNLEIARALHQRATRMARLAHFIGARATAGVGTLTREPDLSDGPHLLEVFASRRSALPPA